MKSIILAFSGQIGSGKSTISCLVADELGWKHTSFGDYVRTVARDRNLELSREILQDLGSRLINEGWEHFCKAVLEQAQFKAGEYLVVDGVRHTEALNTIRDMTYPSIVFLIYIQLEPSKRQKRLEIKGLTDKGVIRRIEEHSTEKQVQTILPQVADLIVDGSKPRLQIVNDIVTWIKSRVSSN